MTTILWIAASLFVLAIYVLGWALCAAAKRGDEMDEDCQFTHDWAERRS